MHTCSLHSQGLKNKFPESFDDPTIRPLLECDWHDYLANKKKVWHLLFYCSLVFNTTMQNKSNSLPNVTCASLKELRGEVWQYTGCLMSFANGQLLGDERKLSTWAEKEWKFSFHRPQALYMALAEEYYTSYLRSTAVNKHDKQRSET